MKRTLVSLCFCCLAAVPLLASNLLLKRGESEYLDVINSSYSVECAKGLGYGNDSLISFTDGEWQSKPKADSEPITANVWISDYFFADLIKEMPGKEAIVQFHCNDGGTGSSFEVQVINGQTGERVGEILSEFFEYLRPVANGAQIALKTRKWQAEDQYCCPSAYEVTAWEWRYGGWRKVSTENWKKEEQQIHKEEKFPQTKIEASSNI